MYTLPHAETNNKGVYIYISTELTLQFGTCTHTVKMICHVGPICVQSEIKTDMLNLKATRNVIPLKVSESQSEVIVKFSDVMGSSLSHATKF